MTLTFSQGVVHVGINYRLGALGFTALEGETWGNQGLRDQVEGIRVFIFIVKDVLHVMIF